MFVGVKQGGQGGQKGLKPLAQVTDPREWCSASGACVFESQGGETQRKESPGHRTSLLPDPLNG
jgi:hypothetical protein